MCSVFVAKITTAKMNSTIKYINEIAYVVVFDKTAVEPLDAIKVVIKTIKYAKWRKPYAVQTAATC